MNYRTWIEIDASALEHNAGALRVLLSENTLLMAVVKANAYGHGLSSVVQALAPHVDRFGVENIDEAMTLRGLGVTTPILLLGRDEAVRAEDIVVQGIHRLLYDEESLAALSRAATRLNTRAFVHVKVDTGMGRQGVSLQELPAFLAALEGAPGVVLSGIATHLAAADDPRFDAYTMTQLEHFREAYSMADPYGAGGVMRHVAASAGAIRFSQAHYDLVRIGLALYGIHPAPLSDIETPLRPVMRFVTRIAHVKKLPAGHAVGYGLMERLSRDSRVALLPVGYADGYDRRLSHVGEVLVAGKRARVLGVVMMNVMALDVTDISEAKPGDVATLLGRDGTDRIAVEELADHMETIPYEVIARLNPAIPRVLV